uniref:(northern house mosquito) hypothetical protein n=1 Tax=Culex pipiens TaxID=7175 RepID=A0A8D8H6A5_CULPI
MLTSVDCRTARSTSSVSARSTPKANPSLSNRMVNSLPRIRSTNRPLLAIARPPTGVQTLSSSSGSLRLVMVDPQLLVTLSKLRTSTVNGRGRCRCQPVLPRPSCRISWKDKSTNSVFVR